MNISFFFDTKFDRKIVEKQQKKKASAFLPLFLPLWVRINEEKAISLIEVGDYLDYVEDYSCLYNLLAKNRTSCPPQK